MQANVKKILQALFFISEYEINDRLIMTRFLLGGIREGEIPDPIPNSEVKPFIADGTAHKSVGE